MKIILHEKMVKYVTWGYFLISLKIKKSDGFVQCFFGGQNFTTLA